MRLKEKAEPEAVDALTVCDDLERTGELEEAGGTDYVHSLPAEVIAAGNVAALRADRQAARDAPAAPRPPRGRSRSRCSATPGDAQRAGRASREGAVPGRPRRGLGRDEVDRGRARRGGRPAGEDLARGDRVHRHPVGLHGARRDHRRVPARQPDRARRPAGHGQVGVRHQHRRERRARARQGRSPCSRSRCPRRSSPSASSPPRPSSTATTCAGARSSPTAGRR